MNPPEDDLHATARELRRGTLRLSRRLRTERPRQAVTLQRLALLVHLNRHGSLTPGELAQLENVQPQSLSRPLVGLERDGLITRTPDPDDRRRARLEITAAGIRTVREDMRRRDQWLMSAMSAQLTPTERQLLGLAGELMQRLAAAR
ncbi:MAG TPA: MarR family transcriptional regulator [Solirubrobacteraceae bacterium]|jgi:DNA-binding MarR family transcriptional regulator|nr:MarR family transcriptional regulator [Solirubrobacteraceae bacterium]